MGFGIRETPYFTEKDVIFQREVAGEASLSTQIRYEDGIEAIEKDNLT